MSIAIGKLVAEDPSFQVETDEDSGETILKGMGELHLDIKVDILKRTYGVELEVGQPQVAYRETITQAVEDSYTHKKQSGGSGQFGRLIIASVRAKLTLASSSHLLLWAVTYLKNSSLQSKKVSQV